MQAPSLFFFCGRLQTWRLDAFCVVCGSAPNVAKHFCGQLLATGRNPPVTQAVKPNPELASRRAERAGSRCGRGRRLCGSSTWTTTRSLAIPVQAGGGRERASDAVQSPRRVHVPAAAAASGGATTGVVMDAHLSRLVPSVLVLVLVLQVHLSQAAPQRANPEKPYPDSNVLTNPFGSGEEERRLLQRYIELTRKDGVKINTRDEEVFYLFRLYDFDRSERLDGLEMMKLLSDYNSQHAPEDQSNDMVVSLVDFLLQSQDVNKDGLLAPSELLSSPLVHTEKNNNIPVEDQRATLDERMPDVDTKQEQEAAKEEPEEPGEHVQPHQDEGQQEVRKEEESLQHLDEHNGQQVPEHFAAEQRHEQEVPAHQGQPEI
ncbi:cell growth regulator with EF hand domain protein 1 [Phycodurus eques]|uniref:cell growth regulator with EF hand domain protein 1 n=1 Tax=Phycodurus eques TaxID=693459 RepID=UPI002ACEB329|nr:cell growth regulator with EF hand domain protein 1 [Phycodurus eques]